MSEFQQEINHQEKDWGLSVLRELNANGEVSLRLRDFFIHPWFETIFKGSEGAVMQSLTLALARGDDFRARRAGDSLEIYSLDRSQYRVFQDWYLGLKATFREKFESTFS